MAKYFRTPDIDIKTTRVKEGITEKSLEATLLEKIDEMIEKNIPLTKTRLSRETNIGGNSFKTYETIFDDTINMLRMFELGTKDKSGDVANVPNFDKLSETMEPLIKEHLDKIIVLSNLYVKVQELSSQDSNIYGETLEMLNSMAEALFGYWLESPYIHEDFIGVNSTDDVTWLIEEKYKYNQSLREKISRLEKQIAEYKN